MPGAAKPARELCLERGDCVRTRQRTPTRATFAGQTVSQCEQPLGTIRQPERQLVDFIALAFTRHAAEPLLQSRGRPRKVAVDDGRAALELNSFGEDVRREQESNPAQIVGAPGRVARTQCAQHFVARPASRGSVHPRADDGDDTRFTAERVEQDANRLGVSGEQDCPSW